MFFSGMQTHHTFPWWKDRGQREVGQYQSFPCVQLFVTPKTIACQASLLTNSRGKNTGVDSHSLLQGISPTQGWTLGLLHYRRILYHLRHQGSNDLKIRQFQDFLGNLVVKTPCFHCSRYGFNPWWGAKILDAVAKVQPKRGKKKKIRSLAQVYGMGMLGLDK